MKAVRPGDSSLVARRPVENTTDESGGKERPEHPYEGEAGPVVDKKFLGRANPASGSPDRAGFMEHFAVAGKAADRNGKHYGLLLLDMDNFGEVNRQCGYRAGDQVLATVAVILGWWLRPGDLLARWGDDEFMIFMHDMIPQTLSAAATQVMTTVRTNVIPGHATYPVSASIGTCLCAYGTTLATAIARVDAVLWEAKFRGGDRIVFS